MKTSAKTSASAQTTQTDKHEELALVKLADVQRTIRIPGNVDTALLQLQVKRRLKGMKCRAINDLILEAVENLLIAEELHPLNTVIG